MIKAKETNLLPAGYHLFSTEENFLQDLSEKEESMISGGNRRKRDTWTRRSRRSRRNPRRRTPSRSW